MDFLCLFFYVPTKPVKKTSISNFKRLNALLFHLYITLTFTSIQILKVLFLFSRIHKTVHFTKLPLAYIQLENMRSFILFI